MQNYRVLLAFLLVPLVPVILYFLSVLAFFAIPAKVESPPVDILAFVFGFLPFSYGFTVVVWLPAYIFMARHGLTRLRNYTIAGAILFFLVSLLFVLHNPAFLVFSFFCALMGALYGSVFWRLITPAGPSIAL
jgi:hypothetical protein